MAPIDLLTIKMVLTEASSNTEPNAYNNKYDPNRHRVQKPGQSISQAKHFQLDFNDVLLVFSCLGIIFLISIINLDLKLVLIMVRVYWTPGHPDSGRL